MSSSSSANGNAPRSQLALDRVKAARAGRRGRPRDDLAGGEHARVGTRLGEVLRPQPPVEGDRGVQPPEVAGAGVREARHAGSLQASRPSTSRSSPRDARDLTLADLREEGQRERARGDPLTDRELALAMAEPLAIEAHQVDRRKIGLALDPALGERADGLVAIDARRAAERRTRTIRARRRRDRGTGARGHRSRQRLAVALRGAPRAGRACPQPLELGYAERAGDVGEAIVEAEPVVVEPVHVRGAALVSLGVDPLLLRRIAHRDHPALAGRQLLVRVEPEHRGMAAPADGHAVGCRAPSASQASSTIASRAPATRSKAGRSAG